LVVPLGVTVTATILENFLRRSSTDMASSAALCSQYPSKVTSVQKPKPQASRVSSAHPVRTIRSNCASFLTRFVYVFIVLSNERTKLEESADYAHYALIMYCLLGLELELELDCDCVNARACVVMN
jgi:hypothetical protein